MDYTLTKNANFGSLEVTFDGKPAQIIREGLERFPLDDQNGGDHVIIEWSEHPAFYEHEERGGLKLSIMAADWILGKLDAEQPRRAAYPAKISP